MLDSFKSGKVPKPGDVYRKIEVIGSGLGRTGTMSFSAVLEKLLDGPVYHSGNMLISDEECEKSSTSLPTAPCRNNHADVFVQQLQKHGHTSSIQTQISR
jgi:Sulfotransferase domain